jgi:hypothetical protein
MITIALGLLLSLAPPTEASVTIDIERAGDLRWQDSPCTIGWRVGDNEGSGEPVGKADIVVRCKAEEGTLAKSLRLDIRGDVKKAIKLVPGFVTTQVLRDGKQVAADVVVYDSNNMEVGRGRDRVVLPIDAGRVRVVGMVDQATAGLSQPARGEVSITIKPREKVQADIDTSDGQLTIQVTHNGKPAQAVIGVREPGSPTRLYELKGGEPQSLPPGTWDIVTQVEDSHDFTELLTKGVVIKPQQKVGRTISHRSGSVRIRIGGAPKTGFPPDAVGVDLLRPGADKPFNSLDVDAQGVAQVAQLSPGKYVIRATRKDITLDDGGHPSAETTINVSGPAAITLTPMTAQLDVEARIGGQSQVFEVSVSLPQAAAPFAQKNTAADGLVSFALPPGGYQVALRLNTAQGELTMTKTIKLTGPQRVRMDLDLAKVLVTAMDAGTAVAADLKLYNRAKNGAPTGEPVLAGKTGTELYVPPGIYLFTVELKGKETLQGELKVATGKVTERTLEWKAPTPVLVPPTATPAAPIKTPTTTKTTPAPTKP